MERDLIREEGLLAAIRQSFWYQEKVAKEVFARKKFNYGLTFKLRNLRGNPKMGF
jgi:hypothetical protein